MAMSFSRQLMRGEFDKRKSSILSRKRRVLHNGDVMDAFNLGLDQMHLQLRLFPIFVDVTDKERLIIIRQYYSNVSSLKKK